MVGRREQRSLPEVHGSVPTDTGSTFLRRLLTFTGPAFMVSVGYMDPGNWATDVAAGAQFGYRLLWVVLLSNLMAILLQTLSARLGLVTGRDLAQACRDHYPPAVTFVLWVLCEIAIAACDLAEVLGSAIGLNLLTGLPLFYGVLLTALDVLLLLALQSYGIRKMEAVVLALIGTIGACFAIEMFISRPAATEVVAGLVPGWLDGNGLYLAIGILGATVMPHNLYLHSALVQSRAVPRVARGLKAAAGFNLLDSVIALNAAFLVNAGILVLAAAAFHRTGHQDVATLEDAHQLLAPLLGSSIAPVAFAIALLAAGQSSTITGTMAGQVVMEGFIALRMRPWARRLLTRSLAIVPAVLAIGYAGDRAVGMLLVLSQVVLSLQLSFAVVPLVHFTSDRRKMRQFATPWWGRALAWICTLIIVGLNAQLVLETIGAGLAAGQAWVQYLLLPSAVVLMPLLAWMIAEPLWRQWAERARVVVPTPALPAGEGPLSRQYRRIALALEVSPRDSDILAGVIPLVRAAQAEVVLMHVVESAVARFLGEEVDDAETKHDGDYLERVSQTLQATGLRCVWRLGMGEAEHELARMAEAENVDLIVTGAHGHRLLGDLFHGATVSELRHLTRIPVLTIRTGP